MVQTNFLGGGNNLVKHNYAGVFGCNITTAANNTFHVECLNAINTPVGPGGVYPAGTVYYQIGVLPFPFNLCKVLFLQ